MIVSFARRSNLCRYTVELQTAATAECAVDFVETIHRGMDFRYELVRGHSCSESASLAKCNFGPYYHVRPQFLARPRARSEDTASTC